MSGTPVMVTVGSVTDSIAGWARRTGLSERALSYRYNRGVRGSELVDPGRRKPKKTWNRVQFVDRTGQRYGSLTVLRFTGLGLDRNRIWLCRCDCGEEVEVAYRSLSRGSRVDCGGHKSAPYNQLPTGESAFNQLLASYKRSARSRGIQFALSREDFRRLTSSDCFYCGHAPSQSYGVKTSNGKYLYNGIDRVDNSYGYLIENTRPACSVCNLAKRDLDEAAFAMWAKRVASRIHSVSTNRVQWRPGA